MTKFTSRYFLFLLSLLCGFYLVLSLLFDAYTMISVDEFWFAHLIYRYSHSLPYKDFAPYKTVLGYYFLLLPYAFSKNNINVLFNIKYFMTALNTILFFLSACWFRRFFSVHAILLSLGLLFSSDIVLSYASNIRVDLLAYWLGFFAMLVLLEAKFYRVSHKKCLMIIAGLLTGLAFCVSQKMIWYIGGMYFALGLHWIFYEKHRQGIIEAIFFSAPSFFVVSTYILFWSYISNFHTVWQSMFREANIMYQLNVYAQTRQLFWQHILSYNLALFILWPISCISLFYHDKHFKLRVFVLAFVSFVLCCLIPYKQVFPYYMQITIPLFFMLYASFFTWFFTTEKYQNKTIYYYLSRASLILIGILFPLTLWMAKVSRLDNHYQIANLKIANMLLKDGSDYVAGVDFFDDKPQTISGMKQLMAPTIKYLYSPNAELKQVMLASLDQDPNVSAQTIVRDIEKLPIKFYINNYRMMALPSEIKHYLQDHYEHFYGSIYVYAPKITNDSFIIKFSGHYLIEVNDATIDGKRYKQNDVLWLEKGAHSSVFHHNYRLKLLPDISPVLINKEYREDNVNDMVY